MGSEDSMMEKMLDEITTTAAVPGYDVPVGQKPSYFYAKPKKTKKKKKEERQYISDALVEEIKLPKEFSWYLDHSLPIPRDLVDQIAPESKKSTPIKEDPKCEDRIVGSYESIKEEDIDALHKKLNAAGFTWSDLIHENGTEVMYYHMSGDPTDAEKLRAVGLRARDLGIHSGPLSISEHEQLGKMFGKTDEEVDRFTQSLIKKVVSNSIPVTYALFESVRELVESGEITVEAPIDAEIVPLTPEQRDLVADNMGLAVKVATKYYLPSYEMEDKIQEAYMALIKAAQGWDPNRDTEFSTYAWKAVENKMNRLADLSTREPDVVSVGADPEFALRGQEEDAGEIPDNYKQRVSEAIDDLLDDDEQGGKMVVDDRRTDEQQITHDTLIVGETGSTAPDGGDYYIAWAVEYDDVEAVTEWVEERGDVGNVREEDSDWEPEGRGYFSIHVVTDDSPTMVQIRNAAQEEE